MISPIIDIIVFICGAYLISITINMKVNGEISKSLIGKALDIKRCRDLEGYKTFLFPRALVLSIATTILGLLGLVNQFIYPVAGAYMVWLFVMLFVLFWYMAQCKKGVEKYW